MNRELESALLATYPTIYQKLMPRFAGGSRFECDDGWYRIIAELSRKLEGDAHTSVLLAVEVREKLGSLRFRVRGDVSNEVDSWLAAATRLSQVTCERCSQPSTLRGHKDGRVRTLCPACATAMNYVME
ncbi:hypothetical protein [Paraburkholderia caballeronis]|uniref:hypothetical protein n=1 Tax=Paraburkholderia caballeronis TaxID=416943 RepID=UPI001066033A|nr:hypothetical protein [Paraburkholderia caballeronis]TDV00919.1 hypothetical protein C7408_1631 [Paraburkholderia caballeronis]TDV05067.1 hypothetical protein C7406_1601 [Paraburkholderia caballeronis]TDV15135.1 hypothetical protein C7404_1631 [Paraburkholderia caballeronis]